MEMYASMKAQKTGTARVEGLEEAHGQVVAGVRSGGRW